MDIARSISTATSASAINWISAASHPINAMLNYAYAEKQAELQIKPIADGFDPTIRIMHNGRLGLPPYIVDQIEMHYPLVDPAILDFIRRHKYSGAD